MTVALVANIARPISSAISTAFSADSYGLLSSYGLLGASANPDAVIEALFANSEVGAWYDPSDLTKMFQDRVGTTPVTADGQTVGLILDKSKGLVLGSELVTGSPVPYTGNGTVSIAGDTITATCTTNGVYGIKWSSSNISNVFVKITFDVVTNSLPRDLNLYPNLNHAGLNVGTSTGQKSYLTLAPTASGGSQVPAFVMFSGLVGESFSIKLTSIKQIAGNHAVAPSDAARPLYKTDGTYHWLQFDGVDDSLSTAAIDFTSTDKMSVFGGILTNMGAYDSGFICELSSSVDGNAGSFALSSGAKSYNDFGIGRGIPSGYRSSPVYTQPTTKVISGAINIAGTSSATIFPTLRVNAASVAEAFAGNTSSAGTAFGNYSMFIGRRSNALLPLNGNIYSLIVRGALSTTQEITETETWVNGKTGAY